MVSVPTLPISESGTQLLELIIIFTAIITVVVALRFYAALALAKRRIRIDDWLILLAWLATVVNTSMTIWAIPHGLGYHLEDLGSDQLGVQYKNFTSVSFTWLVATCGIKASILCFYRTIFTTNSRTFRIILYTLLGAVAGYFVTFFCIFMTQCTPIYQEWDPQPGGHCRNLSYEEISSVCINIVMDLFIIIMPLPTLWRLQMEFKNKLTINFLLCTGFINTAIMIWRLVETVKSETLVDFTYGLSIVLLVADLELWIGIIAASLPTLMPLWAAWVRPLIKTVVSGVRSRAGNSKHGGDSDPASGNHPTLVTFGGGGGGGGGNANSRRHANKNGTSETVTKSGYFELEDGYMLHGERNLHAVKVQGGVGGGGDGSSIGGSSGGYKEHGTRKSQDIEVRQEVLVTDTLGSKAFDRA